MCGRYSITSSGDDIWDLIDSSVPDPLKPSKNIVEADFVRKRWQVAPNDWVPAILNTGYTKAHWWLLPSWTKPEEFKWRITGKGEKSFSWASGKRFTHFNSRVATLTDPSKRYWYKLLDGQRCLIPANGFVEWSDEEMLKPSEKKRQALFYLVVGGIGARRITPRAGWRNTVSIRRNATPRFDSDAAPRRSRKGFNYYLKCILYINSSQ